MSDNKSKNIIELLKSTSPDKRFVGSWSGTDHGKFFKGETNSWTVNRKVDGTFTVTFKTIHQDDTITFLEDKGFWGVNNQDYYEYRDSDEQADHYTFLFLSKDSIHFIINEKIQEEEPYNFIDFRSLLD